MRFHDKAGRKLVSTFFDKPQFKYEPEESSDQRKALKEDLRSYKDELKGWYSELMQAYSFWEEIILLASRGDFNQRRILTNNATRLEVAELFISSQLYRSDG